MTDQHERRVFEQLMIDLAWGKIDVTLGEAEGLAKFLMAPTEFSPNGHNFIVSRQRSGLPGQRTFYLSPGAILRVKAWQEGWEKFSPDPKAKK